MDNPILAALKRATPIEFPKALRRQFPGSRADRILSLITHYGYTLEEAIENTASQNKRVKKCGPF